MPDDNRFAGLSAGLDEEENDENGPDDPARSAGSVGETSAASSADAEGSDEVGDAEEGADDECGPAFEFDETTAKSIYVREETLALLEDTEFEVEMRLRRDHSIRDVTGREFHDAAVHVLEEHVDEVVDAVLGARDSDPESADE